jgi:hypothetical protein
MADTSERIGAEIPEQPHVSPESAEKVGTALMRLYEIFEEVSELQTERLGILKGLTGDEQKELVALLGKQEGESGRVDTFITVIIENLDRPRVRNFEENDEPEGTLWALFQSARAAARQPSSEDHYFDS